MGFALYRQYREHTQSTMMKLLVLALAVAAAAGAPSCRDARSTEEVSLAERDISRSQGKAYILNPINDKRRAAGKRSLFWCPIVTGFLQKRFSYALRRNGNIGYPGYMMAKGSGSLEQMAKKTAGRTGLVLRWFCGC